MDPYQFGVSRTAAFIKENLDSLNGVRLLEVGAGQGRLTAHLRKMGLTVDAIDKSSEVVRAAQESGVEILQADITSFKSSKPYDGIVFCMSAHHVYPWEKAIDQVRGLLRPTGILILEEYAVEDADEPTARWYEQTRAIAMSLGVFEPDGDDDPFLNLSDPLGAWHKEHSSHGDHHFNSGMELLGGIRKQFEVMDISRGPYFYRYLAPRLAEKTSVPNLAESLYRLEEKLITAKQIQPLGLRIVAKG